MWANGELIDSFDGSTNWNTKALTASTDLIKDGVNCIVVEWPVPLNLKGNLEYIPGQTMAMMLVDKIYPVYGEIHTFLCMSGMLIQK